ncbi:MAG: protein-glutamate O-methyltransferase CheR [Candidatus Kapabacteria bacterium]|nr:protein-glutamate O-methyltransferase CheR [Ignavibacteriota bacterium]MCW5884621.1 protein-glutamate O-methyltransferase CheR [Candidatus Kapabacteria bacterium]
MTNEEFEQMRVLIYDLSGIYFTDSKKYLLESRIAKRITANNMKSFADYISFLKLKPGRVELDALFEAITINETYFFRVPQQFEALENVIIPEIAKLKEGLPNPTIRIWSAAASTGEEAYTISIMINERLKYKYPKINFQIIGTDINSAVLESARKAVYKEYAIRNVPDNLLEKYFKKEDNQYILKDEIKRIVRFSQLNLYDNIALRAIPPCDVIFCANVLIYFDIPSKQKVVSDLYNTLTKGGYLFVGYSESLHGISKAFKLVHLPKAMAYQKD